MWKMARTQEASSDSDTTEVSPGFSSPAIAENNTTSSISIMTAQSSDDSATGNGRDDTPKVSRMRHVTGQSSSLCSHRILTIK